MNKKDFKKINNYLWEIPKTFRQEMRVPARVYASEEMLENILQDQSIPQLINGTTLPGIVKYGIAMPDCHEGYSVPIGFVGAIRTSDGVISPGACVTKNTQVLHSLGYRLPIKNFENNISEKIYCARFKKKNIGETSISKFFKLKANPHILKITTKTGQKIKATPDHPFYTPKGMVDLEKLKPKDKIALYPFQGVEYQPPKEMVLADEKKLKEKAKFLNQDPAAHGIEQMINQLKKRNLLPLKTNSPQFPYLLKIIGYLLGDGTMFFVKKRKRGQICFYGRFKDLQELRKDIKKIGFTPSKILLRKRDHKIKTLYSVCQFSRTEYSIRVSSSSLTLLLWTLGIPIGDRTKQDWVLPEWLFELSLWQKRLFLAAFFGAELSSPKTVTGHGFNFYCPVLGINKNEKYIKSGRKVLLQIAKILEEFGVKKKKIISRKDYENDKKEISYRNRLILSSKSENLINLWSKIGYEYHQEKQFLANLAVHFIKTKQKFIEEKILSQGIKARKRLIRFQKSKLNSLRKLITQGDRRLARPFIGQFPIFKEFIKKAANNLGKSGIVWDEIEKIEKIPFSGYVYDFTVTDVNHNFIANNFVVSNCGFDINCGMRLLKSDYTEEEIKPYLDKLAAEIQKEVPSGLGRGRQIKLTIEQVNKILEGGVPKLVEQGYGEKEDVENCEEKGRMRQANASVVSEHAKNRGRDQIGTLGSGNHFLEIQKVSEIFDKKSAEVFGLFKDQVVIMIHTGSRGLGHQVCSDYLKMMIPLMKKYKINVPDREFACVPFNSPEGRRYFGAMASAANYAWANRHMISYYVRRAWKNVLGKQALPLVILYDVAHNIVKKEKHKIDGENIEVIVHRKGSTRAFPPGHLEIPEKYRKIGQPVLIPGTMGTNSYVLVGTENGKDAWFSTCHGAGRTMSRHAAMRKIRGEEVIKQLKEKGILVKCHSFRGIAEEAPLAYKNVDNVVETVHRAGLSRKVAKLTPLAVIKGE